MTFSDPDKQRAARRRSYLKNKAAHHAGIRRLRREKLEWVRSLKVRCERCGQDHPATLHFHHLGGKELNLGKPGAYSWEKLHAEIAKCIVLCANCHAIEHAETVGFRPEGNWTDGSQTPTLF